MQNDLSSRMEKLWAMSDIALRHGTADYGFDGHCKAVRLAGLSFFYLNGILARVRGPKMDVTITRHEGIDNDKVVMFPGMQTILNFLIGHDAVLAKYSEEFDMLNRMLSPKKAA